MTFFGINGFLFSVLCFSMAACSFSTNMNQPISAAQSDTSGEIDLSSVPEIRDSKDFVAYLLSDEAEEQVMGLAGRNSKGGQKASNGQGNGNKDKQQQSPAANPKPQPSKAEVQKREAEPPRVLAQTSRNEAAQPKARNQAPTAKQDPKKGSNKPENKQETKATPKPTNEKKQPNSIRVSSKADNKKQDSQKESDKKKQKKQVIKRAEAAIRKQEKLGQRQVQRQGNLTMAVTNLKDIRAMPSKGRNESKAKCDAISAAVAFLKRTSQPARPFDGMRNDFRRALKLERDKVLRENKLKSCAAAAIANNSLPVSDVTMADEEIPAFDIEDQVEDVAVDEIVNVEEVVIDEVVLEEPTAEGPSEELPVMTPTDVEAPVIEQPATNPNETLDEVEMINRL